MLLDFRKPFLSEFVAYPEIRIVNPRYRFFTISEIIKKNSIGLYYITRSPLRNKSRIGRNPNKPSHVVTIPTRKVVKFKMGRIMKALVMKPVKL